MSKKWFKKFSPKRRALSKGHPSASDGLVASNGLAMGTAGAVSIVAELKRLAEALPVSVPKRPGRPPKVAPQVVSRQQLRYRDRMLLKADEAMAKLVVSDSTVEQVAQPSQTVQRSDAGGNA